MDFLDPRKKRARRARLSVGYGLMAVMISIATVILVYETYGFSVDTKTGDIVENGLLFVGSQPDQADIYLNAKLQDSKTNARLVLPSGKYQLLIKKPGYRDWKRSFSLQAHTVERYIYPFLMPVELKPQTIRSYVTTPPLASQSPDRRWLLLQVPATGSKTADFELYDTTKPAQSPLALSLPSTLLTATDKAGSNFKEVEWSSDNRHLLLEHAYSGGSEFIIFDRETSSASININKTLNISPNQVALFDKKVDRVYLHDKTKATLQIGDLKAKTVGAVLLNHVLAFKSYATNTILYVTNESQTAGKVMARIWDNGDTYPLYEFSGGSKYLVDVARFSGDWYFVAGSDAEERINLYKNPLDNIKNPEVKKALPVLALRELGAQKVSFSTNVRFVAVQGGQNFAVYDIETQQSYRYNIVIPLASTMAWMDGHRLMGQSAGQAVVFDYDGTNQQILVPSLWGNGAFFDRSYKKLFVLGQAAGATVLQNIDLLAGDDLPD